MVIFVIYVSNLTTHVNLEDAYRYVPKFYTRMNIARLFLG